MTAPVFSSAQIPIRIRAMFAVAMAAVIFPVVSSQSPAHITLTQVVIGGAGEIMIGLSIGLALTILLSGAEVAGRMIGQQGGIALGEVIDPTRNERSTVTGQLYSIVLVFVFLVVGGHRATVAAVLDTYQSIPMLSFQFNESIVLLMVQMLTSAMILGIRLAGPVLVALFLVSTVMGFLSRTIPQLNILSVGFTIRVLAVVGMAGISLTASQDLLLDVVWEGFERIRLAFDLDPVSIWLIQ